MAQPISSGYAAYGVVHNIYMNDTTEGTASGHVYLQKGASQVWHRRITKSFFMSARRQAFSFEVWCSTASLGVKSFVFCVGAIAYATRCRK
jgi:hypothetical protein